MKVHRTREWVSFSIADGREGNGANLVEGRGVTLDDAIQKALELTDSCEQQFGLEETEAQVIWRNGDLAAVIRPPMHAGHPYFVVRFDFELDEEQPEALDAACSDYLAARQAMWEAADAKLLYCEGLEGDTLSEAERSEIGAHDSTVAERRATMNGFRRAITRLAFEALGLTDPSACDPETVPVWHPFGIETDRHTVYLEPHRDPDGEDLDYSDPMLSVIPRATIVRLHKDVSLEA